MLFFFLFVRGSALGLIAVAAVAAGVEGVGGFDLVLELIAGQAGILVEVLHAADVLVLSGAFGLLHLGALDDRACEGIDLAHMRLRIMSGGARPRPYISIGAICALSEIKTPPLLSRRRLPWRLGDGG